MSLRTKFTLIFTITIGIISAVVYFMTLKTMTDFALEQLIKDMEMTLEGVAKGINVDEFVSFATQAEKREDGYTDDPRFWKHVEWLYRANLVEPRALIYTYVKSPNEREILFIGSCGALWEPPAGAKFLEPFVSPKGLLIKGLHETTYNTKPYTDKWGSWISIYSPLEDDSGKKAGAIGIDFRADDVIRVRQAVKRRILVLFFTAYIILFLLVILLPIFILRPMKFIMDSIDSFGTKEFEERISVLSNRVGHDEIGKLSRKLKEISSSLFQKQSMLRRLSIEASKAEERERRLIATELHDHIGQELLILKLNVSDLKKKMVGADLKENELCMKLTDGINENVQKITNDTRLLIAQISSPLLYEIGLIAALEALCEHLTKKFKININHDLLDEVQLKTEERAILYRMIRELLINSMKHSEASVVTLSVQSEPGQLIVKVSDDGRGFNSAKQEGYVSETIGFGLFSIRERIIAMGGTFSIHSAIGIGTNSIITYPHLADDGGLSS